MTRACGSPTVHPGEAMGRAMLSRSRLSAAVALLTLSVAGPGCELVIDARFDDLRRAEDDGAGGTSTAAVGSTGSGGGAASAASSTSTAAGGEGGEGGGAGQGGAAASTGTGGAEGATLRIELPPSAFDAALTGSGTVISGDRRIDCGETCAATYDASARVTLQATPSVGSAFHSWDAPDGACSTSPREESCTLTVDGDLTVSAYFVSKGANLWGLQIGSAYYEEAYSVALDADGGALVTGIYNEPVSFGGVELAAFGGGDVFVARFDRHGAPVASRGLGSAAIDWGHASAVDPQTDLFLVGGCRGGAMDLGEVELPAAADHQGFVVALDAQLDAIWAVDFGGPAYQCVQAFAIDDATGAIHVAVNSDGDIDTVDPPLPFRGGINDLAIARLTPEGDVDWITRLADGGAQYDQPGRNMAVDGAGRLVLSGLFTSVTSTSLDWNHLGGSCDPLVNETSATISYVARLDPEGACVSSRRIGAPGAVQLEETRMALTADGGVVLTGSFLGELDLDGAGDDPDAVLVSAPFQKDAFIARLGPSGEWVPGTSWAHRIGEPRSARTQAEQAAAAVSVDARGGITLLVKVAGTVAAGGRVTAPGGYEDILMVGYDQDGTLRWVHRYGSAMGDTPRDLACDPATGTCFVAGRRGLDGPPLAELELGGIASNRLPAPAWWDVMLARFAP